MDCRSYLGLLSIEHAMDSRRFCPPLTPRSITPCERKENGAVSQTGSW
jgi:hypothetical protein